MEDGIEFLKSFDIVIHPRCQMTHREFLHYSWKVDKRTNQILPVLADKDNHVIDSARYALGDVGGQLHAPGSRMMAKIINFAAFGDTPRSFVGGLGGTADKAASTYYDPINLAPPQLLAMYKSSWVARKIVNIPAFDAFREWRDWQGEDQQLEDIKNVEKRLALQSKLLTCMVRARLYGGCALYISTGEANPEVPLGPKRVTKGGLKFITIMPRTKLQADMVEEDPMSPDFGSPVTYKINRIIGDPIIIHKSRLVIFTGENSPTDAW